VGEPGDVGGEFVVRQEAGGVFEAHAKSPSRQLVLRTSKKLPQQRAGHL
jgi:hypothetical protein